VPREPADQLSPLQLQANTRPTVPRIARIQKDDAGLIECRLDRCQRAGARVCVALRSMFLIAISDTPDSRGEVHLPLMSIRLEIGFANALR
jgi:hypothetical protein